MLAWLVRYHGITLQVHFATVTGLYFELKCLLQIEHTSCTCLNTDSGLEAPISADCASAECNSTAGKPVYFRAFYAEQEHCRLIGSEKSQVEH